MAKSGMTQRVRIIKRVDKIKQELVSEDLILSDPAEELLERLVIAIQDFLALHN